MNFHLPISPDKLEEIPSPAMEQARLVIPQEASRKVLDDLTLIDGKTFPFHKCRWAISCLQARRTWVFFAMTPASEPSRITGQSPRALDCTFFQSGKNFRISD